MRHLAFEQFRFNSQTLELRANGQVVTLRPKTAELLRELINARDRVVAKRELIANIWHTEHVTDQSVFQAISELRAVLAPLTAIRTFPNRGYQWVLPINARPQRKPLRLAAAMTFVSLMGLAGVYLTADVSEQPQISSSVSPTTLPALVAFGEGASALQRGDVNLALEYLGLSVVERPEFIEARLLLAEAYLVNGEALEARQRADNVMSMLAPESNAYSLIAAMDLMSRADQQLGQMTSALEWATRAADQANSNGYECTAADLHDRVLILVQDTDDTEQLQASPVFASEFAQRMLQTAMSQRVLESTAGASDRTVLAQSPLLIDRAASATVTNSLFDNDAAVRPAHCERLRGFPSSDVLPFESVDRPLENRLVSQKVKLKPLI
ncbi:MAG: winged helix-turn-helix domain-containing protein [Gammaproteobacteria bacterium]